MVVAIVVSGKGPISFDAGRAAQNMLLAAWNEGVGGSPNGISDERGGRGRRSGSRRGADRDRALRSAIRRGRATRSRRIRGVREILPELERWRSEGERVVVATVVANRRSAPRPVGSSLAISESGKLCGSVSGGCVESDVYEQARDVFETGEPKLVSYGITDDEAWSVGLPCGGEIDVFVERL